MTPMTTPILTSVTRTEITSGVRYSPTTDGLVLERPAAKGSQYEIDSLSIRPAISALIASDNDFLDVNEGFFTALPSEFPTNVRDKAIELTASVGSRYEKSLALEKFFQENFTYDLSAQSTGGKKAIERFLFDTQRGYCEQFSGTFAAMARSIGIPARVAVGFTQGQKDANGVYHVSGRHAHANFCGILQRLGVKEDGVTFATESPPEECDFVLGTAHAILLRSLPHQQDHFALDDLQEASGRCSQDCTKVWERAATSAKEA